MPQLKKNHAFSLVELVIVIVILGIIAAIAIPRISSGSKNAGESALKANLATMRNGVAWYYAEHFNTWPGAKKDDGTGVAANDAVTFAKQLSLYSDATGKVSTDKDAAFPYGPYVRGGIPGVTLGVSAGKNDIVVKTDASPLAADDSSAWMYNVTTGELIMNSTAVGNDGKAYSTY
ncbi:MAG: prepilin-type N-terminal cleavage/methylation domain-containing protein [Phycisphaerae bacterium]|nr:prepilin-type N-terminal cleavage/methylation domain-containing protein [Phycisphaerae bacterium]